MSRLTGPGDFLPGWVMAALNFGMAYPEGDQDDLFALGDAWRKAAAEIAALKPDLRRTTDSVPKHYTGSGADAMVKEFALLFGDGDYSLDKLVDNLNGLGDDTRRLGTDIEYTKIQEELFALLTVWTVAQLCASFYGASLVPAFLTAARQGMATFAKTMMEKIVAQAGRAALRSAAKPLTREIAIPVVERAAGPGLGRQLTAAVLKAGGLGATMDAGIQGYQIMAGHRDDGMNWRQTLDTAIQWGAGALAGAPAHVGLGKALGKTSLSPRLGGLISGGVGGMVAGGGMYLGGLGTQLADNGGDWDKVNKTFHPQLLIGGALLGGAGGMTGANRELFRDRASSGAGEHQPAALKTTDHVITDQSKMDGRRVYKALSRDLHPDIPKTSDAVASEAQRLYGEAHKIQGEAGKLGGYSEQHVARLEQIRDEGRQLIRPDGSTGTGSTGVPEHRAGQPSSPTPESRTVGPDSNRSGEAGKPPASERAAGQPAARAMANPPAGDRVNIAAGTQEKPAATRTDSATSPAPSKGALEIDSPTPLLERDGEPLRDPRPNPGSHPDTGAALPPDQTPATAADHGAQSAPTVEPVSDDTAAIAPRRTTDSPEIAYEARQFSSGDDVRTILTIRVHLDGTEHVPDTRVSEIIDNLRDATDSAFNSGYRLIRGEHLRVELEITDDPAIAHLHAVVDSPHLDTAPQVWTPETSHETFVTKLREQLGLSTESGDYALTPTDTRRISDDIDYAHTGSLISGLPETRTIGPGRLGQLEHPSLLDRVRDALRGPSGFLIGADPRTNPYGDATNGPGPHVPGRSTNCIEGCLAGLSSFYGDPQVAHPAWIEMSPDGTLSVGVETGGFDRAEQWIGKQWDTWGRDSTVPIDEQFDALHDHLTQRGELSAAIVTVEFHTYDHELGEYKYDENGHPISEDSHSVLVVYPRESDGPIWWDQQHGTFSEEPPLELRQDALAVWYIDIDPNELQGGTHGAGQVPHQGTGGGVPGTPVPGGHPIQPLPERVRLGLSSDKPPAGVNGTGQPTPAAGPGEIRVERQDGHDNQSRRPASADDRADVRQSDTDRAARAGVSGVSPSLEGRDPAGAGGRDRDRVPVDDNVPGRTSGARRSVPADSHQAAVQLSHERRSGLPGVEQARDLLGGDAPPNRPELAEQRDPRVLEGTPPATSGREPADDALVNVHGSDSHAPVYEVRRYRDNSGAMRTTLSLRVELEGVRSEQIADVLRGEVDRVFNTGTKLLNDDLITVELVVIDQPEGDPAPLPARERGSHPEAVPDNFIRQVREQLGLPADHGERGFTPEDIRRISNDIHTANTRSPFGELSTYIETAPEVMGDGTIASLELPEFEHWVQDASRTETGFAVGFDPRTHPVADVINDGGMEVPGRSNNCALTSLAALFTFHGRPTVALPIEEVILADGNIGPGSGLAPERVANILRADFMEFDSALSIPEQYRQLADLVESLGPGASAFVATRWQALDSNNQRRFRPDGTRVFRGGHATVIVYPLESAGTLPPELAELFPPEPTRPIWWDPQSGETSVTVPDRMVIEAGTLHALVLRPDGTLLNARTTDSTTGSELPRAGTHIGPRIRSISVRGWLGDLPESDAGGAGSRRLGDAADNGGGLAHRGDQAAPELVGRNGDRRIPQGSGAGGETPGRTDLSAPNSNPPGSHSGRPRAGALPDPAGVPGRAETGRAGLPAADRQADVTRPSDRHVVENGDGLGDREQIGPNLAGDRDFRVLADSEPDGKLTGPSVSEWDPIGPERSHPITSPRIRDLLGEFAERISEAAAEQRTATGKLTDIARALGLIPDGLGSRQLEQAIGTAIDARTTELEAVVNRSGIAPEQMIAYFDERRSAIQQMAELTAIRSATMRAFNDLYSAQSKGTDLSSQAEAWAVQDVLDAAGARTLSDGVGLVDENPPMLLAVSRTVVQDYLVGPDLRRQMVDDGVDVRYLQVRVDNSGRVMVVEVHGPATSTAQSSPAPGVPPEPDHAGVALLDRLHVEREQLSEQVNVLGVYRDELARSFDVDPASLERLPMETIVKWQSRINEVIDSLRNRPWKAKGVSIFQESVPLEEYPQYRWTVEELHSAFNAYQEADASLDRINERIETAQWLESERSALNSRRETLRDLLNQLAEDLRIEPESVEPRNAEETLARLREPDAPIEGTAYERAVEDLARKITDIARLTTDIGAIDADLGVMAANQQPVAYRAQLVRDLDTLVSDREFWREKRNSRAARMELFSPDNALAPGNLPETLARLRQEVVGMTTTAAVGDEAAQTIPETVNPAEAAHRNRAIDNLQDAAERFNELTLALSLIEPRIPTEIGREAVVSDSARAEIDEIGTNRARIWQDIAPWRKMRGDLAARLEVDIARLGPDELSATLAELRNRTIPAEHRAEYDRQLDFLAEASKRTSKIENSTSQILNRMAELAGAGREVIQATGVRPITDRVGLVEDGPSRVIVAAPHGGFEDPRMELDTALRSAINLDSRLARVMSQPQTVIDYRAIVGNIDGPWHIEQLAAPARIIPTLSSSFDAQLDFALWQDGQGRWHPIQPSAFGWKESHDPEFKIARFYLKDPPDGMTTHALNTLHAAMVDPFVTGHAGQIDKAFLTPVPMGGRMDADQLPTFDSPFSGTEGALARLGVELPKLVGIRLLHADDPYTFHPHIKKPGWYTTYFETKSVERQPMVRQWEPWEHDRSHQASDPSPRQRADMDKWAQVQEWADEQYARFRADDSDLAKISGNLASKSDAIRESQADRLIDEAKKQIKDRLQPDFSKTLQQLTGHLRHEKPGDAKDLLDHVIAGDRIQVAAKLADAVFTHDQLSQIKNHLMRDELLINDPLTGDPVRRQLDPVADVAESWHRLIDGTPLPADILLLRDALSESNYLRENPSESWRLANQHAIARGYDWDSNRPPPAEWRARLDYAPSPLEMHSPLPPPANHPEGGPKAGSDPDQKAADPAMHLPESNRPGSESNRTGPTPKEDPASNSETTSTRFYNHPPTTPWLCGICPWGTCLAPPSGPVPPGCASNPPHGQLGDAPSECADSDQPTTPEIPPAEPPVPTPPPSDGTDTQPWTPKGSPSQSDSLDSDAPGADSPEAEAPEPEPPPEKSDSSPDIPFIPPSGTWQWPPSPEWFDTGSASPRSDPNDAHS